MTKTQRSFDSAGLPLTDSLPLADGTGLLQLANAAGLPLADSLPLADAAGLPLADSAGLPLAACVLQAPLFVMLARLQNTTHWSQNNVIRSYYKYIVF